MRSITLLLLAVLAVPAVAAPGDAQVQAALQAAEAGQDYDAAAIAAVRQGHGLLMVLSYQVAEELAAGSLVRILRAFEPPPIPMQLVMPTTRLMPPRVRAFLDLAVPRLSALDVLERG